MSWRVFLPVVIYTVVPCHRGKQDVLNALNLKMEFKT